MSRLGKHLHLGWRWLICGARLMMRNPALLVGMGVCTALPFALLWLIPLFGGVLIALMAPILYAGFVLAAERVSRLSRPLTAELRAAALRQAPRELFAGFRHERHIMPLVALCVYALFAALLINMVAWAISGSAWVKPWAALGWASMLSVVAASLLVLLSCVLLALTLVFTVPRVLLRDKHPLTEIKRSFQAGMHYRFALLPLFALLLTPMLAGALAWPMSPAMALGAAVVVGSLALPLAGCALYCSYRTVFPPRPAAPAHHYHPPRR